MSAIDRALLVMTEIETLRIELAECQKARSALLAIPRRGPVEEALERMVESFSDSRCSCHEEEEGDTCYRCLARGSAMEAATKALKP